MDKVAVYSALGGLIFTHTLPATHTYILLVEVAVMSALDGVSYGMRSEERDWGKVLKSLRQ
jgi:small basic protein